MEIKYKNLPLYRIVVNPEEDETGMTCISFVDYPAIETDFMCFKEEKKMAFSVVDGDQHIVTGPAIIRDMPIYRYSPLMGEYYTVFDQNAIDNIILKYSKYGMWNNVSLQHDGNNIEGVTMVEFYKKDSAKGIVPKNFEDVTDGSLFVSYKIEDDALWNEIKNGTDLNGFSIEINADLEPTNEMIDDGMPEDEDDFWDELMALFDELGLEPLFADEKKKFRTDWELIDEAIDKDLELEIRTGDKTIKGYVYSTYKKDGSRNLAVYDGEWHIVNETNITSVQATGKEGGVVWGEAIKKPDFKWIEENIDKAADVKNIQPEPKNDYERALIEHRVAMITYVDEVGRETGICVGNRQCGVFELGFTRAGNACMRVYQYFGPTHHDDDPIPAWRNLLYSRIRSFRIVDWMKPLTNAPFGFNETGPDRDGFQTTLRSDLRVG